MSTISEEECSRRVAEFLEKHKDAYTEEERAYIQRSAFWALNSKDGFNLNDEIRQILSELNLLEDNKNIYQGFANIVTDKFDINRNVVEIAGGIIPSLAKIIALKQKEGTITVYYPRIIKPDSCPDNLIIKRQSFTTKTPLPGAEMLIAFMPCDATMDIIDAACERNIDFIIGLCEGGTRKGYGYLEYDDEWIGMAKYIAERGMEGTDLGSLGVASLEEYGSPYPVIYNKRKKS